MCNLYSITINQAAIIALFRLINRYVGNLPPMPGNSTAGAIQAGVFWAVAGGIKAVVRQMSFRARSASLYDRENPVVFMTGGDAELLEAVMDSWVIVWPEMTLEGIRIAAEGLE